MIKRRKKSLPIIPTASMGDIAFLLIIFFMLASNFMKSANVKAEEPASPDVEQQEPALVSVIYDQEGKLWLQGVEIGMGELAAPEHNGDFHLVTVRDKSLGVFLLHFIVMVLNIGTQFDFFQRDDFLFLFGFFIAFLLFKPELAEIHDSTGWRFSVRSDFH